MAFVDRDFVACLKCMQNCFESHCGADRVERPDLAPSFILLQHPTTPDRSLNIPRQFSDSFLSKCYGKLKLEGPKEFVRCVELKQDNDGMALANPGWSDFATSCGFRHSDKVLFTYLGRSVFKVRFFDAKGHEKEDMGVHDHDAIQDACGASCHEMVEFKAHGPEQHDHGETNEDQDSSEASKAPSKAAANHAINHDNEMACEDEMLVESHPCGEVQGFARYVQVEEGIIDTGGKSLKSQSASCPSAAAKHARDGFQFDRQDVCLQARIGGRALTERQGISHAERQCLVREANAFTSKYPLARKALKPSYDHKMVLTKAFVEKFMPDTDAHITLTDPQGKDWPCKWLAGSRFNHYVPCLSAGWSQFFHAHELKTHDILVFELIDMRSLHFNVHFFKPKTIDVLSRPPYLMSLPARRPP